ncbi:MAG: linear amide C-N hydrolase [Leptospiraceae bacterium]|nr:linear amide C-N hydrolase [Leptospiraceae bacterium]
MKARYMFFLLILICSVFSSRSARACSTFSFMSPEGLIMGKSYDFGFGHGMLVTNKRNVHKMGLVTDKKLIRYSAEWTSKYGSITFNQFGRELPSGGINEKGLVIEQMWLVGGKYPLPNQKPTVNELQWMQYQLDNYATVQEVIENASKIQIAKTAAELHYLLCDATQKCGIIDFVDGRMLTYSKETLPLPAITNSPYLASLAEFEKYKGKEYKAIQNPDDSMQRFSKIAYLIRNLEPQTIKNPYQYAFHILDEVSFKPNMIHKIKHYFGSPLPASYWNTVYNTKKKEFRFRTYEIPTIREVSINAFDFSCKTPVKVLHLDEKLEGNVNAKFKNYSKEDNKKIVDLSYGNWSDVLPPEGQKFLIEYPDKLICEVSNEKK